MLENVVLSINVPGIEIFSQPVDLQINPTYQDYIFHPMDLGTIKQKVIMLISTFNAEIFVYRNSYEFK